MTRFAIAAILIGLALAAALFAANDVGAIVALLRHAGWALAIPVVLHLPQVWASALGWRTLVDRDPVPGRGRAFVLRWVKEGANALLPLAQIGGDVVRARLFVRGGAAVREAAAVGLVDIGIEMAAQIAFTLIGVALLLAGPHGQGAVPAALAVAGASVAIGGLALAGQRLGVARMIERIARSWTRLGDLSGLDGVVTRLVRARRRVLVSAIEHLASWLLGAVETFAALGVLGLTPTVREAVAIEALVQAARAAGFLIPGALGVQEGGTLLVAGLFGIAPHVALALSLVRRVRDLAIGGSGLLLWHRLERHPGHG